MTSNYLSISRDIISGKIYFSLYRRSQAFLTMKRRLNTSNKMRHNARNRRERCCQKCSVVVSFQSLLPWLSCIPLNFPFRTNALLAVPIRFRKPNFRCTKQHRMTAGGDRIPAPAFPPATRHCRSQQVVGIWKCNALTYWSAWVKYLNLEKSRFVFVSCSHLLFNPLHVVHVIPKLLQKF